MEVAACFSVFTENKHGGLQSHYNAVGNTEKPGRQVTCPTPPPTPTPRRTAEVHYCAPAACSNTGTT